MNSEVVKANVLLELRTDKRVDSTKIGVSIREGGVMVLSGRVDTLREKLAAEDARRVFGVTALANEIEVHVPGQWREDDAAIAQNVKAWLDVISTVPPGSVTVTVTDGWITLEGAVDHYYQKKEAGDEVSKLMGVTGVFNNIEVLGGEERDSMVVQAEIEQAFMRKAQIDARALSITVQGRRVILEGTVRGWAECNVAIETAWSIQGVSLVENRLQIVT